MNPDYLTIKQDLKDLGLLHGDSVVVHSSFRSLGKIEGGIETLVSAIMSVIGDNGTFIVPTLTYVTVSVQNPVFDYLNSPACTGAVCEFVRNMEDSIRSIHPTHSCAALGGRAEYFTSGHENDRTPCGENSPFRKNLECGGKILMLGCNPAYNTTFHAIEEIVGVSFCLNPVALTHSLILPDRTYTADYHRHNIVQSGFAQRYNRMVDVENNGLKKGLVHGAESHLFSADIMGATAISLMKNNEEFFVEKMNKEN